jgi:hypothetical protein
MSITRAQIATQLLNKMAPKGEKLAYINNREAELLKRMGGAGVDINKTGIKSYYYDEVRGLDKALPYLAGFIGSKLGPYPGYKAYDVAKTNVEKQQEELNQFINAPITGSFYVPGQTGLPEGLIAKSDSLLGFQNRAPEPTIPTFTGGDNEPIIPMQQMQVAETPTDVKAFSGSGIGGTEGLGKRGFEKFGKRLFSPTGTDGISNFLLNPFGKSVEKGITLEPESVKNFAKSMELLTQKH